MLLQRIQGSINKRNIFKGSLNCECLSFKFSHFKHNSLKLTNFKQIHSIKHSSCSLKIVFFNSYRSDETYIDFEKDYYQILGVSQKAELHEIKQRFYILAKQYHPDKNKGQQSMFKQINEAYNILSQAKLRNEYDSNRNNQSSPKDEAAFQNKSTKSGSLNYQPYSQMSRAQWAVYRNGFMAQSKVDYSNYAKTFDPQKNLQLGIKQAEQWNRAFRGIKKEQVEEEIQFRKKIYKKMKGDMQQRQRQRQQFYDKKFERIGDRIEKMFGKTVRRIYNNLIKK